LTNSLYVSGELSSSDKVLVDVGTGFLIEKVRCFFPLDGRDQIINILNVQKLSSATKFYEGKVSELTANLKDLEIIIHRKQTNARTVEEGMANTLASSHRSSR
jgi:prefoldin alpha subunit